MLFDLLYDPANKGYDRAIIRGEEYVNNTGYRPDALIYLYRACGYGQRYDALSTERSDSKTAEMARLQDRAAKCVNEVLRLDPSLRELVECLLGGGGKDDDLKSFNTDDFRRDAGLS